MTFNENLIREAAYYNWQNAGCPVWSGRKVLEHGNRTDLRFQGCKVLLQHFFFFQEDSFFQQKDFFFKV